MLTRQHSHTHPVAPSPQARKVKEEKKILEDRQRDVENRTHKHRDFIEKLDAGACVACAYAIDGVAHACAASHLALGYFDCRDRGAGAAAERRERLHPGARDPVVVTHGAEDHFWGGVAGRRQQLPPQGSLAARSGVQHAGEWTSRSRRALVSAAVVARLIVTPPAPTVLRRCASEARTSFCTAARRGRRAATCPSSTWTPRSGRTPRVVPRPRPSRGSQGTGARTPSRCHAPGTGEAAAANAPLLFVGHPLRC